MSECYKGITALKLRNLDKGQKISVIYAMSILKILFDEN